MKILKPTNNAQRNTILIDYQKKLHSEVKKYPRHLFKKLPSHAGRNNQGKITIRHQGASHKKIYRIIDFKRYSHDGVEGTIKSIEYKVRLRMHGRPQQSRIVPGKSNIGSLIGNIYSAQPCQLRSIGQL